MPLLGPTKAETSPEKMTLNHLATAYWTSWVSYTSNTSIFCKLTDQQSAVILTRRSISDWSRKSESSLFMVSKTQNFLRSASIYRLCMPSISLKSPTTTNSRSLSVISIMTIWKNSVSTS